MDLLFQDTPVRFEIGTQHNALTIRVRRVIWEALLTYLNPSAPLIASLQQKFHLPEFISPVRNAPWGFGYVMQHDEDESPDWIAWLCPLPKLHLMGDVKWNVADAFVCTLLVFFSVLQHPDLPQESGDLPKQLMTVDLHRTARTMNAFTVSATFAPLTVKWIRERVIDCPGDRVISLDEVMLAMRDGYAYIWRKSGTQDRFIAFLRPAQQIYLQCPGDACELASPADEDRPNMGTELDPHNVDDPGQQLAFLMGLAALHEMLRRDGL